jgi:alpha-tubulin suppressor-like RCC1 family protein
VTTRLVPRSVVALHQIAVTTVACGVSHSLASTRSGEVWSWGGNAWGQLGHGDRSTRTQPIHVRHLHQVVSVAAGHSHSAAVTRNEALFAWGYGRYGALGLGSLRDEFVPRRVQLHVGPRPADDAPLVPRAERRRSAYGERMSRSSASMPNYGASVRLLACGPSHTVAVDSDNRVWHWGGVVDVGSALPQLAHYVPPTMSEAEVAAQYRQQRATTARHSDAGRWISVRGSADSRRERRSARDRAAVWRRRSARRGNAGQSRRCERHIVRS